MWIDKHRIIKKYLSGYFFADVYRVYHERNEHSERTESWNRRTYWVSALWIRARFFAILVVATFNLMNRECGASLWTTSRHHQPLIKTVQTQHASRNKYPINQWHNFQMFFIEKIVWKELIWRAFNIVSRLTGNFHIGVNFTNFNRQIFWINIFFCYRDE